MQEDQDKTEPTPFVFDIVTDYNHISREANITLSHAEIMELLMVAYNTEKDMLELGWRDRRGGLQPLNMREKD